MATKPRNAMSGPIVNPMTALRLTGSCAFGVVGGAAVVGGTAAGMATMSWARPSSNLACETEKLLCS